MNDELINALVGIMNVIIRRAVADPVASEKIRRGESLTREDFDRLGSRRDAAGDALDEAINEVSDGPV